MTGRIGRAFLLAFSLGGVLGADAQEIARDEPRPDVPEWLSEIFTRPHGDVASDASVPPVSVQPLGQAGEGRLDAVGLLPASITGLPTGLWGASQPQDLVDLIEAQPVQGLPAMQAFSEVLALAELDPPLNATTQDDGALFLARVDLLFARGALDAAQALIERAGPTDPALFGRWFDISLLTGHSQEACAAMNAAPGLAPDLASRIFCLARGGDWSAAALALSSAEALGSIDPAEAELIARFLDPELAEDAGPLPPGGRLSPLLFQMRVALAERPDAAGLPLAYVYADLRSLAGWRAQLDAVERLSRSGALESSQWLAVYTAQAPSASGAIWDRVAALQAFDAALSTGDPDAVAPRLAPAWAAMAEASLQIPFADIYAGRLLSLDLPGESGRLTREIALLSPLYEQVARASQPETEAEAFAFAIARGEARSAVPGASARSRAVAAAFADPPPAHRYRSYIAENRTGEALLRATRVLTDANGDADDLSDALVLFRSLGQEDVARRAALQLLLLPERT